MFTENTTILAPMADITGPEFRILLEKYGGCDLYFTEMLSSSALIHGSLFEYYYKDLSPSPGKTVAQLISHDTGMLCDSASIILENEPSLSGIDINMGCSAPLIYKKGGGISWMNRVPELTSLIKRLKDIAGRRTVSAKLRIGFEKDFDHLAAVAISLQDGGADFITVHGRSKKEKFKRRSDWSYIDRLRDIVNIPVIGNGDIRSYRGYVSSKEHFRASAVMIGRKAVTSPWFFSYLKKMAFNDKKTYSYDLEGCLNSYINISRAYVPEKMRLKRFKRFCLYFSQNLFWDHAFLVKVNNSNDFYEASVSACEYFNRHPEERLKKEG